MDPLARQLEFIPVLYTPGHFGTWISWLINQHSKFPKYTCMTQNRNLPVRADIWLPGADFYYHNNLTDWDTYYSTIIDPISKHNKNVSKFSFKFLPNQNFRNYTANDLLNEPSFNVTDVNKIFSYIGVKKTVITLVDNTLVSEIKKRWQYLENDMEDDKGAEDNYQWQLNRILDYNMITADYLLLDVGKMLIGSMDEYKKLTEFIDEPPLDSFAELSKSYYDFAFNFINLY